MVRSYKLFEIAHSENNIVSTILKKFKELSIPQNGDFNLWSDQSD